MTVVGRISGPLLKANLLRDGVNLAFETSLLYLDVNNRRIGINTSSPTHDLHVNGTLRTTNIDGLTSLTVGANFLLSGNTLSTSGSKLTLSSTSGGVIYQNNLTVSEINIQSNIISTNTTNTDLQLVANGTGKISVYSDMLVQGNIHATGNITADGNIIIGNQPSDIVTFNADIASNIIPKTTNTYDLGSTSNRWNNLWTNTINANTISTTSLTINGINILQGQGNILYVATNGSNSNNGISQNSPYATLQYALSQATSGTTVYIYPGTYQEILPLSIPSGVSIKGIEPNTVIITPTPSTSSNDVFLIDGQTTVEDLTIKNFYYNSSANTGYAFKLKNGFKVTTKSPYIRNVFVITSGSVTSNSDPKGFLTGDAGKGIYFDGSVADSTSNYVSCLVDSTNFITPGVDSITATNGVRLEIVNSNTYYSNRGIYAYVSSSQGRAGNAYTVLRVSGATGSYSVGSTISYYVSGSVVATGTIYSIGTDGKIYISGYSPGFVQATTVNGILQTQDIRFSTGATAQYITLADYRNFGAEIRAVGSGNFYGNYGVVGNGIGVYIDLLTQSVFYVGSGNNDSNDPTTAIQANEIVSLNNALIVYTDTNHNGDFRVGGLFYVNQETNDVAFNNVNLRVNGPYGITLVNGSNSSSITPYQITTGNLTVANNTISSTSGNINLSAANNTINLQNDTYVTGSLTVSGTTNINGNITLGSSSSNTINFVGSIASDLIPLANNTYNLGNSSYSWSNIYAKTANISNVNITNNNIQTISTGSNLYLSGNGTGSVNIGSFSINQNTISVSSSNDFIITPGTGKIVNISSTGSLQLPSGTSLQRPTAVAGMIRYNTDNHNYEGYNGSNWIVLNGLYDVAQTTYITPELTPGAGDQTFRFYIGNTQVADLNSTRFNVNGVTVGNTYISNNVIGTTSNTDLTINSSSGNINIEYFRINGSSITNTVSNSITTISQSGTGYFKISGTGGFVIPSGNSLGRPSVPEIGFSRYNTDDGRIEVWNGASWVSAGGSSIGVSYNDAQQIAVQIALMLG